MSCIYAVNPLSLYLIWFGFGPGGFYGGFLLHHLQLTKSSYLCLLILFLVGILTVTVKNTERMAIKVKKESLFEKLSFVCVFPSAVQSGDVSGCSNEFKSLMSMPTPGALQLKKHLTQGSQSGTRPGSISVPLTSDLCALNSHAFPK